MIRSRADMNYGRKSMRVSVCKYLDIARLLFRAENGNNDCNMCDSLKMRVFLTRLSRRQEDEVRFLFSRFPFKMSFIIASSSHSDNQLKDSHLPPGIVTGACVSRLEMHLSFAMQLTMYCLICSLLFRKIRRHYESNKADIYNLCRK